MKQKTKKKALLLPLFIAIFVLTIIQIPKMTTGQTFILPTHQDVIANSPANSNVLNTGCDVEPFNSTDRMSVFVFDGDHPGFSWKCSTSNGTIPIVGNGSGDPITDPDVVLSHDGTNALIVYIQSNRCYFESKRWSGSVFVVNQSATVLGSSGCLNPNVDIAYNSSTTTTYVVATWAENGTSIKGCAGSFSGGSFSFSTYKVDVSNTAPGPYAYMPDVCIYNYGTTYPATVTFTFIDGNIGATHYLYYRQTTWSSLFAGSMSYGLPAYLTYSIYPNVLNKPRIAAPVDYAGFYPTDFQIVAGSLFYKTGVPFYQILGYNQYLGISNYLVVPNSLPDITTYYNGEPVVTYAGDLIEVQWVYHGDGITGFAPNEIIVRKLNWNGNVAQTNNYSVDNYVLTGSQICPSVAARYCPNSQVLYTFYDSYDHFIKYKFSSYSSNSLKLINPASGDDVVTNIYPNPASDNVTVDLNNDENWAGAEMEILNAEGQIVKKLTITDISTTIDVSGLDNGLYFMKLVNNENVILKKILINH